MPAEPGIDRQVSTDQEVEGGSPYSGPVPTIAVSAVPDLHQDLRHTVLDNGLRVVLVPQQAAPVVAVAVLYDVGIRSEPEGRTGFAHLFEHMMFQGSRNVAKLEHARTVQSSGGVFNGSTHFDYTNYFETLPADALERGLFLEADRMRAPLITQANLDNQIAVVKEEIRVNVLNRPYGGFPWIHLPAVAFETFANSHNGYGSFVDLDGATVDDARAFFDTYYAPANAVLAVGGAFDPDEALEMVHRHFADIAPRIAPVRPSFAEPAPAGERRSSIVDALAPMPAVAIGYRVPDPAGLTVPYLALVLLCEVLTDGDASRLQQRLVQRDRLATDVNAYLGEFGDPFDERDPTLLTISAHYPQRAGLDSIVTAVDDELRRVAADGLVDGELDRVRLRLVASLLREADSVLNQTLTAAKFQLVFGSAALGAAVPGLLAAVTAYDVSAAARDLLHTHRTVLEVVAGPVS